MANTMRIGFRLANFKELQALLSNLPAQTEKKVVGVALEKAAGPIEKAAKRLAAKATGALRASITHTLRQYPKKTVVIIGPDRDYYQGKRRMKKGEDRRLSSGRPANYAHLVEFGHRIAQGGSLRPQYNLVRVGIGKFSKSGKEITRLRRGSIKTSATGKIVGQVAARPFLRPAVMQGEAAAAREFEVGIAKGLEREIKKLNRKIIKAGGMAA